jgi:hypothetical protein
MNKHMIPRLVFGWPRFSHRRVPLFSGLKRSINVHNNTPIFKETVMDKIANCELGRSKLYYGAHLSGAMLLLKVCTDT